MVKLPTLYMMVGLPGSGKSFCAEQLSKKENAVVISSDEMRVELFGNVENQENNGVLFDKLFNKTRVLLKDGKSVIIDATNINSKRRMNALKQFKNFNKICIYMATPYAECLRNDRFRSRTVGKNVIDRMYKSLHVPMYYEGWDKIEIVNRIDNIDFDHEDECVLNELKMIENNFMTYNNIFNLLEKYDTNRTFSSILSFGQDNPHHTLSVCRHTYYVYENIAKNYHDKFRDAMIWAAIFHDTGKPFTKEFKTDSKYASFYGHENVSAQLAVNYLKLNRFDDDFILKVSEIVLLHMKLLHIKDESGLQKLREMIGNDMFIMLEHFRNADVSAK